MSLLKKKHSIWISRSQTCKQSIVIFSRVCPTLHLAAIATSTWEGVFTWKLWGVYGCKKTVYISLANDKDPYWTKSCVFSTQIFTIPNLIILDQLKFLFLHLVAGLNQPSWNIICSSIGSSPHEIAPKKKTYLRNHHPTCIVLANDKLVSQKLTCTWHWQVSILT